jgi:hypothetical protein
MAKADVNLTVQAKGQDTKRERQESLRLWRPCVMGIAWLSLGNVGFYMYSLEHDKTLIRVMRSTSYRITHTHVSRSSHRLSYH